MQTVLDAIGDGHRRELLDRLRHHPASVNELASTLPIARAGVSRHLRVLREAGLVEACQVGQSRIYSLAPEPLAALDEWLEPYRALWQHRMEALHTEIARGKKSKGERI